jgi:hypothetical protein
MRARTWKPAVGSALTLIAALVVVGGCNSSAGKAGGQTAPLKPAASQALTTTEPPAREFVSQRHHFSVTLPQDWSEADASFDWDGKALQSPGSPFFTNFTAPTSTRTVMAASTSVPKGTQLAQWQAAMVRAHVSSCADPSSVTATTLGGEPALTWTEKCDGGTVNSNKIAALHGGRGYMVYMPSSAANDAEDRRIFEEMRQSFRFTS